MNVKVLEERFESGAEINVQVLAEAGIVRDDTLPLKVLGEGDLTKKFTITAEKVSGSARTKIEAAGGTINIIERTKVDSRDGRQGHQGRRRRLI